MAFTPALRLALWEAWDFRCAWCRQALTLQDVEVEHLIAKGLKGESREEQFARFGLELDYDLDSTENLVPAHRRCNGIKSNQPLADAPIIAQLRDIAASRAPSIDAQAEKHRKGRSLTKAVAAIGAADPEHLRDEDLEALEASVRLVRAQRRLPDTVVVHPAVRGHEPETPNVEDVTAVLGRDRMLEMMLEWHHGSADALLEVAAEVFDAPGQRLERVELLNIDKVGYAAETDLFLVRMRLAGEYTHFDSEGIAGPADAEFAEDVWVLLDDARAEVLQVELDLFGAFPD